MAKTKDVYSSFDTEELQTRNLNKSTIADHIYKPNGWVAEKVKKPNVEKSNESRVIDPKHPYRELCHSYHVGRHERMNPFTEKSYWFEAVSTFTIAGLCKHRPNNDRVKRHFRDTLIECVKANDGYITIKRLDLAIDIELADFDKFYLDNFFLLDVSSSQFINSPFDYYEKDGSRTYYLLKQKKYALRKKEPKKEEKYVPKIRYYMYLKHEKEGLKDRFILRFEASYSGLDKFDGDAGNLIHYIENELKSIRLFCFDNVKTGNHFKQLYRDRIPKKGYPNVTPKQLREITSKADNEFKLELTDELRDHIHNVLAREEPKPVESSPIPKALNTLFGKSQKRKEPKQIEVEPTKKTVDQKEPKSVEVEPISMGIRNLIRESMKSFKEKREDNQQAAYNRV